MLGERYKDIALYITAKHCTALAQCYHGTQHGPKHGSSAIAPPPLGYHSSITLSLSSLYLFLHHTAPQCTLSNAFATAVQRHSPPCGD